MTADVSTDPILQGIPERELRDLVAWRAKVAGKNISDVTLLATDYLNHINEIVMLIEMVPDMPEMLDECRLWEPLSYQEHFRRSSFSDRDLAIAAYDHVPAKFRRPFEETVDEISRIVTTALDRVEELTTACRPEELRLACLDAVRSIQDRIGVLIGVIHGSASVADQSDVDHLIGDDPRTTA